MAEYRAGERTGMAQTTPIQDRQAGAALVMVFVLFAVLGFVIGHLGPVGVGLVAGAVGAGMLATPPGASARERGQRVAVATGVAVPVLLVLTIICLRRGLEGVFDGIIMICAILAACALSALCATQFKD